MSTLVSYLLAVILQFIGVSIPMQQESLSVLTYQKCEEATGKLPNPFILKKDQELKQTIREK